MATLRIRTMPPAPKADGTQRHSAGSPSRFGYGLVVECTGCGERLSAVQKVELSAGQEDYAEAVVTIGGVQVDVELELHKVHLGVDATGDAPPKA